MTTATIARANDALGTLLEVQQEMIPLAALLHLALGSSRCNMEALALAASQTCKRLLRLGETLHETELETHTNAAAAVCAAVNAAALLHLIPPREGMSSMHLPSAEYIAALYQLEPLVQRYASDDVIGQVVDRIAGEEA